MWTKVITKLPLPKIRPSILYFICIFILFWGYIYMCFLQFNTIVMLVNILWIIIIKTMQFKEIVKHNKTSAKSSAFIYYNAIIWERWSYLSTQFVTYLSPYSYKHNKEKFFFHPVDTLMYQTLFFINQRPFIHICTRVCSINCKRIYNNKKCNLFRSSDWPASCQLPFTIWALDLWDCFQTRQP